MRATAVLQGRLNTEDKMRNLFQKWSGWGIKGIKVDYSDSDSKSTMELYEKIARVTAEYHLMVNFHGATKPNGLMRKYPNVVSQEAVYGAEQTTPEASHNVSLVFTRNPVGPTDYTPVTYLRASGRSTWAHQTAMSVVYTSYIQHFADHWAVYRDSVAAPFLRTVPTVWDETRLIEGYPDQYATIARRQGSEWYVGTIAGGSSARTATIPLSFLPAGVSYTAQIYQDGLNDTDIAFRTQTVTRADVLSIPVRTHGGAAIRFTTQPSPVALTDLAAGKPATADSICTDAEGANKAVNGSVAGGNVDKWCSSRGGEKWPQVDLGGVYSISQFAVRHAGAGGESANFNTRDFNIQISTDQSNWATPVRVTGNTANATTHPINPVNARYVRLNVTTGAQGAEGNIARIYGFEAYGQGVLNTRSYYKIVNRNSGKALAVKNALIDDATPVLQWDYADATTNDEWRPVDVGGGYYEFVNHYSGKVLDVNGATANDGATLIQFTGFGSPNQQSGR
jgi:hypothetical protein